MWAHRRLCCQFLSKIQFPAIAFQTKSFHNSVVPTRLMFRLFPLLRFRHHAVRLPFSIWRDHALHQFSKASTNHWHFQFPNTARMMIGFRNLWVTLDGIINWILFWHIASPFNAGCGLLEMNDFRWYKSFSTEFRQLRSALNFSPPFVDSSASAWKYKTSSIRRHLSRWEWNKYTCSAPLILVELINNWKVV